MNDKRGLLWAQPCASVPLLFQCLVFPPATTPACCLSPVCLGKPPRGRGGSLQAGFMRRALQVGTSLHLEGEVPCRVLRAGAMCKAAAWAELQEHVTAARAGRTALLGGPAPSQLLVPDKGDDKPASSAGLFPQQLIRHGLPSCPFCLLCTCWDRPRCHAHPSPPDPKLPVSQEEPTSLGTGRSSTAKADELHL